MNIYDLQEELDYQYTVLCLNDENYIPIKNNMFIKQNNIDRLLTLVRVKDIKLKWYEYDWINEFYSDEEDIEKNDISEIYYSEKSKSVIYKILDY